MSTEPNQPFENFADQDEKLAALKNDRPVRNTYLSHVEDEPGGRFKKLQLQNVVGSTPIPNYPSEAPTWSQDRGPDEPPLGYSVDAQDPTGEVFEVEASLATAPAQEASSAADIPPTAERAACAPTHHHVVEPRRSQFRRRV